ncbi:MAG: hypothetical protein V1897_00515 [Pseudomonadota bacterium]
MFAPLCSGIVERLGGMLIHGAIIDKNQTKSWFFKRRRLESGV